MLAVLQIVFGSLSVFSSWLLAGNKAHIVTTPPSSSDEIILNFRPPNAVFEFVLLFFGLAILACGFFQRRAHVKYAGWQIIFGLIMTIISAFFSVRAATISHGEISIIYYVMYLLLAIGILIIVTGFAQLIIRVRKGIFQKQR